MSKQTILWFHIHTYSSFSKKTKVQFSLFLANTVGAKPWPKIINSYLLRDLSLTAVLDDLYFSVEAECFTEQEVTLSQLPAITDIQLFLVSYLLQACKTFSFFFFKIITSMCPPRDFLWLCCLIYVVNLYLFCVGLRRCLSGWPSGTSYSSWRPGIWSNSTTCTVTASPWNYGSSLPPGSRVRIGKK